MELELSINGVIKSLDVAPNESLLTVLRREGYYSVRHGCESGECGACTVLVDGLSRPACVTLAAQVGGCSLTTVEGLGKARKLHALQEAFIDAGAVQCGFCTPGMLLSASALLKDNPSPTAEDVREALSGNLCRCTGYAGPVQAVLRAAALLRGETPPALSRPAVEKQPWNPGRALEQGKSEGMAAATPHELSVVGKAERRVDAVKLATGKAAFVDDIELRDMLYARILTSPHAHATIREIDVSEARALPGVLAVLTYKDVPHVPYTRAGVAWPEPGPHDQYVLDNRVRFVGDRVAVVAAESVEIAEQALKLIQVEYETLPVILDPRLSSSPQAPGLHLETESYGIASAEHNLAAHIQIETGDVERGFAQADLVVEGEYTLPQVQPAPLENHVAITYWDEDERLVVRTNNQAPYHVRRIIAPLIGLSPNRIRVTKPGVGGDFGAKRDVVIEDLCALLTIATERPVRLEYTRAEEFQSGGSRHSQIIRMKTGIRRDGTILANSLLLLANTGAYGTHAQEIGNTGLRTLPLYPCPNLRFEAQVVYTNQPPAGDTFTSGLPQGFFALESHLDEVARQAGIDALELRRRNWIKEGNEILLSGEGNQNRSSEKHILRSCGLPECLRIVEEKLQWKEKRGKGPNERFRHGVGLALAMQHITNPGQETASASLKLNEDGSFNLLIGAANSGTGSDTLLSQIAAEILGTQVQNIVLHAADTDFTPFDTSTSLSTSGGAVGEVAELVREQILTIAGQMLQCNAEQLTITNNLITAPNRQTVTLSQVALQSLYIQHQRQIMATASWTNQPVQPSFAAQGVEVEVDTETGVVHVLKVISAIDAGRTINPVIARGQIEGATAQALGYALSEEMLYDQQGRLLTDSLRTYHILHAPDMPVLETYMIETEDPSGPFGAKEIEELPLNALAPAIANAVADALGVRLPQLPLTPERVLRALRAQAQAHNGQ